MEVTYHVILKSDLFVCIFYRKKKKKLNKIQERVRKDSLQLSKSWRKSDVLWYPLIWVSLAGIQKEDEAQLVAPAQNKAQLLLVRILYWLISVRTGRRE